MLTQTTIEKADICKQTDTETDKDRETFTILQRREGRYRRRQTYAKR